jgi:hypothetical protein
VGDEISVILGLFVILALMTDEVPSRKLANLLGICAERAAASMLR